MRLLIALTMLLLASPALAAPPAHWRLQQGTLIYHASDALHPVNGVSHDVRGAGNCAQGECAFLAAAPVNSFASGDTNRDLHMLQTVRGGQYPLVSVRTTVASSALHPGTLHADLEVSFGGHTVTYRNVAFQISSHGGGLELTGSVPLVLSDFQITPPEFLFIKIHNQIPVGVDLIWALGN